MVSKSIHVLLIEDDPDDSFFITRTLSGVTDGPAITVEVAETLQAGLSRMERGGIDVILLDLSLPDSVGLETLAQVQDGNVAYPIVVLTALDDESLAVQAVGQGAQDYLVKGRIDRPFIVRVIRYAIERHRIRIELDRANAKLQRLALVDPLTEILNRRGLQQTLSRLVSRVSRDDADLFALLIDLDNFKQINDSLGHAVGDVVLKVVTQKLQSCLRASDYPARIGGDEFMILLPETRRAEGLKVAEKIRLTISGQPIVLASGRAIRVTGSMGLVPVSSTVSSIDELLTDTHAALTRSKVLGKNRVSFGHGGSESDEHERGLREVHERLRERDGFHAMRHPIFRLDSLEPVGFEFLSRSRIEHFEMPDDFFRLSMENNILTVVDHRCLRTCLEAASHVDASVRCHLNLFPSTMIDIPISHLVESFCDRPKASYCIEISEQQIIGDPSYLAKPVEEIKSSGLLVAIDDVGFGRSCLESLILLEPHIIKIDKGCVIGVARDKARLRSLRRILNVAQALNTEVVAEGIETMEDLVVLRDMGVILGQGFLLDPPVPA